MDRGCKPATLLKIDFTTHVSLVFSNILSIDRTSTHLLLYLLTGTNHIGYKGDL